MISPLLSQSTAVAPAGSTNPGKASPKAACGSRVRPANTTRDARTTASRSRGSHTSRRFNERASLIVTSNKPFGRWGEVFGDETVAAAMIDRLVHHAEVLTLSGDSYRTRARRELLAKDRDN